MTSLQIIAGSCGKGTGHYTAGLLKTPDGREHGVESIIAVEVHGDVRSAPRWSGQLLNGIKGGLAVASSLELSAPLALAAGALGAGLGAVSDEPRSLAVVEATFLDGGTIVAMADAGLAALIRNDRDVAQAAVARAAAMAAPSEEAAAIPETGTGLASQAFGAAAQAADAAGAAVTSAFSFFRRDKTA
ncbi:hypothetical protein [Methylobacterium sp. JK268]